MLVDFHCHTNCSDGSLSPNEIIKLASRNSIKVLSITDHDNIDAYSQINTQQLADIKLISGIEFSTTWNKIGIHIIGLNFNINANCIKNAIKKQKLSRENRAKIISERLSKIGLHNAYDKLKKSEIIQMGRPNFANLLVEEGICKNVQLAFKKYLGAGKIGDVKNHWLPYQEIVQTIQKAKGIAVLAHPLMYKLTNSKLKRLIQDFVYSGGQSIEIINGYQNIEKTQYLLHLCQEFNLLASMGSDFHHHNKWSRLGCDTKLIKTNQTVWNEILIN